MTCADLNEGRDDHLDRFVDDSEAVSVVEAHDIGAHEGEDGHDVQQHFFLKNKRSSKSRPGRQLGKKSAGNDATHGKDGGGGAQQQEGVVMSLRHLGRSDALNHQLHHELLFI